MICRFQIGQKVCCVGDFTRDSQEPWALKLDIRFPVLGSVYTIRDMRVGISNEEEEAVGLVFQELENPEVPTATIGGLEIPLDKTKLQEPSFDSRCFAPLHEAKTDISQFQAMLTGKKVEVDA